MKNFTFLIAVLVSALVIGCQESGNDPVSAGNLSAPAVTKAGGNPDGVINLKEVVYKGESVGIPVEYLVTGTIGYTLVPYDDDRFVLSLVTEAQVLNGATKSAGSTYGESMEEIQFPTADALIVRESFQVQAGEESLRLYIELKVSPDAVSLASINLVDDMASESIKAAN